MRSHYDGDGLIPEAFPLYAGFKIAELCTGCDRKPDLCQRDIYRRRYDCRIQNKARLTEKSDDLAEIARLYVRACDEAAMHSAKAV